MTKKSPEYYQKKTRLFERKLPPCGNPRCSVSTGIHDMLTFGSGKLDNNGFWEYECEICEEAYYAHIKALDNIAKLNPYSDLPF